MKNIAAGGLYSKRPLYVQMPHGESVTDAALLRRYQETVRIVQLD